MSAVLRDSVNGVDGLAKAVQCLALSACEPN